MANQLDIHNFSFPLNATLASSSAGTVPIMFVPKEGGSMTLIDAHVVYGVAPTGTINTLELVSMADAATPTTAGVIGTISSGVLSSNGSKRLAFGVGTSYVSPGTVDKWIGIQYASGTVLTGAPCIVLTYVMGK